jgi:GDP-4-dehydro-6-deoxy-D-mannose reductase
MKVLVTGSCGFVGPYLLNVLLRNEIKVYGVDKHVRKKIKGVKYYQADILDEDALRIIFRQINPDYVFHLAGIASVKFSWDNPELTRKINVQGTRNLIECISNKAKIFFASTAEVYGVSEEKLKESHAVDPKNPYAKSKLEAENLLRKSKFPHVISRSFQHIGVGQSLGFVCPDFAKQIADIEKGIQKPEISVGNLDAIRDFTDVRDIVEAYYLAIQSQQGEIYNICSGKGYMIKDILDKLLAMSSVKIKVKKDPEKIRPIRVAAQVGDNSKFVKNTGWKPKVSIDESLREILNSWRN